MEISLFTTQMRKEFLLGAQTAPAQVTPYEKFTTIIPSTARFENYPAMLGVPRMKRYTGHREWANQDYIRYSVENLESNSSAEIPLRDIEDDQIGLYPLLFKAMGQDASFAFPPRFVVQTLAAGASNVSMDGTNFFATSHNYGAGNSALPANFTGGLNLLNYTSQGTSDGAHYKACFLVTTGLMKPMIYQNRKPAKMMTNSGESRSYEAKKVRYWVDCESAAAYGFWYNAILVNITNTPTIPDCYAIIDAAMNQFRTFTLPQSSPLDPLVYANGSFMPSPESATLIVSANCGQVFWHTLSEERIGVSVAGSSSGFTNNIYRGTFNLVIDPYMI